MVHVSTVITTSRLAGGTEKHPHTVKLEEGLSRMYHRMGVTLGPTQRKQPWPGTGSQTTEHKEREQVGDPSWKPL